ncbi:MAG: RNA-binding protein [Bacteroidales bacterium]|nr:RNA-binding protein [Bacteroidales bacterium]
MNIFVAKLNYDTQEHELQEVFEQFGEVSSVKIVIDKVSGRSKGFGFVEMDNDDEAQSAINGLNETELGGRTIVVKEARPKEERGGNGGRHGGDRNRNFNNRY